MGNNRISFHFFEPETSKGSEKKIRKREPNMFILYRKEMMRDKPYNMTMVRFSKLVSEKWKQLSEDEKTELQRRYQINRDQKSQNSVKKYVQRRFHTDTDQISESANSNLSVTEQIN
ncbi:14205_t:CDS:1 [Funneliformis mosseae]|uniref:14205_t:CDS:1 n=1 Tax=Funneliformis mosseae TaxID=27381 RepID=A0A9N9G304_FUNMO|nr:14205_t:CDS:1 [Funneliformis mosseae]